MKIIILGANGQVGNALTKTFKKQRHDVIALTRKDLNLAKLNTLEQEIKRLDQADCLINATAFTAVDQAEQEPDMAHAINHQAVRLLAEYCHTLNMPFIHFSTDYVFDGTNTKPYTENDATNPINTYGRSKLLGEQATVASMHRFVIIRLSWVFSAYGTNFVKTILKLAQQKQTLTIINDQIGCPTAADDIANATLQIITQILQPNFDAWGIYHYASQAQTTWYDFANSFVTQAKSLGMTISTEQINPIPTKNYPTPAIRPHYTVLDTSKIKQTFGIELPLWQNALEPIIKLIKVNT